MGWYEQEIARAQSCGELQHGHHIDTLPVEPRLPASRYPLVATEPPVHVQTIAALKRRADAVDPRLNPWAWLYG